MPIKILGEGPGIAGYIKIGQPGAKAAEGQKKRPPIKFDHIEITSRARNEAGQLELDYQLMDELVGRASEEESSIELCGGCARSKELGYEGGLPTNLGIYLASDNPEVSFPHRLSWYRGRHCYCWGDGEKAQRREEKKGADGVTFGDYKNHVPCGTHCIDFIEGRCKPDARLRCSLAVRELVGAVYEFRTTSWNSVRNIHSCITQVLDTTLGTVSWVPLVFQIAEQTVQPRNGPANKAMVASLYFPGSAKNLLEATASIHTQMGDFGRQLIEARAGIPQGGAAWEEAPEEVAGFASEFHPEERDADAAQEPEPEDGSGASKPAEEASKAPTPQEQAQAAADAASEAGFVEICGQSLPGGRECHREKGHDGKHSARGQLPKQGARPPAQEPAQEPKDTQGGDDQPPADVSPKADDDRVNAGHEDHITPFQVDQVRRLLREAGKGSAPAARTFLTGKLGRNINSIGDLVEMDFRALCADLDPTLFDDLYQGALF
jgi:hypothetical protein